MNIGLGIGIPFAKTQIWLSLFDPSKLFANGEQGVWYDPSDLITLYQDAAGTTPVTAVEQPVGLMLDKSKGLVLGPELVTNGDFSAGTTGWTGNSATLSVSGGALVVTPISGNGTAYQAITTVIGKTYVITTTLVTNNGVPVLSWGETEWFAAGAQLNLSSYPNGAAVRFQFTAIVSTTYVGFACHPVYGTNSYDNISVRELPGNHAYQTVSTQRPVLSARVNLLTKTEQFDDDAVWNATAGNVSVSGNKIIPTATNGGHYVSQGIATLGVTHTIVVKAKQAGYARLKLVAFNQYANFDLANGVVGANYSGISRSISAVGDGSYICSFTFTSASSASNQGCIIKVDNADSIGWDTANFSGNGVDGIQLYYADLRPTNTGVNLPAYQRVNTATDYDTQSFPTYLKFDGVDDALQTNSIDFTYGDKVFVSAGVRKLSDAAEAILAELSSAANAGTFRLYSPRSALPTYSIRAGGSALVDVPTASSYVAPITNVVSGVGNISAPSLSLRVNGTQVAQSTASQGTGNYGNYPLYIGSRAGTSLFFNGNLYNLIVRGAQSTAAQIESTEQWVNGKTAAF